MKVFTTKRRGVGSPVSSFRQFNRIYYVQNGPLSEQVCMTAFLSIFGISNGRLGRALTSQTAEGCAQHRDQRGHHVPVNKTPQEKMKQIKSISTSSLAIRAITSDRTIRIANISPQTLVFLRYTHFTKNTAVSRGSSQ